jgi:hypothetical protein
MLILFGAKGQQQRTTKHNFNTIFIWNMTTFIFGKYAKNI